MFSTFYLIFLSISSATENLFKPIEWTNANMIFLSFSLISIQRNTNNNDADADADDKTTTAHIDRAQWESDGCKIPGRTIESSDG